MSVPDPQSSLTDPAAEDYSDRMASAPINGSSKQSETASSVKKGNSSKLKIGIKGVVTNESVVKSYNSNSIKI
jgi:hypothetical protein